MFNKIFTFKIFFIQKNLVLFVLKCFIFSFMYIFETLHRKPFQNHTNHTFKSNNLIPIGSLLELHFMLQDKLQLQDKDHVLN